MFLVVCFSLGLFFLVFIYKCLWVVILYNDPFHCKCVLKLSFQEWTQQVQDMLNTKKFGDIAFRDKDFKNAVEYYSKVFSLISIVRYIY